MSGGIGPLSPPGAIAPKRSGDSSNDDAAHRFSIGEVIGCGQNGSVSRAFDRVLGHEVALKAFASDDRDGLFRLKAEFRALRGVAHPNIVQLYELVVSPERAFFTMELLESAVDVVRYVRRASALDDALDDDGVSRLRTAFAQLFDGLRALHDAGLLHRDLKPSNAVVTPAGRTVLLDFGMVERRDVVGAASPGEFAGTPAYAAPELLWGASASAASEAYAAGVLLFEALTGRLPRRRPKIDNGRTSFDARERIETAPGDLAELALALLAPDPGARPDIAAVRRALIGRAAVATTTSAARMETSFVGRRSELAWLGARLDEARTAGPVVVSVRGESGIGKSELVRHFLSSVPQSLVLRGACRPRESVPYNALDGPADDLSVHLLESGDVPDLDGDAVDALLSLFPVFERVPALIARRAQTESTPRELTRQGFRALRRLFGSLGAERPLVLWIDDTQWADADSSLALREILRAQLRGLLVVFSERPAAGGAHVLATALAEASIGTHVLDLRALPAEDCRAMVASLVGAGDYEHALASIVERSEGSPFVLQELCRSLASACGAETELDVTRAILDRIERLDADARTVTEVVALGGSAVEVHEILEVAGCETNAAVVYRMQEQHVLGPGTTHAHGVEIYHDRIRETLISSLSHDRRRAIHRKLAEAVCRRPHPDPAMLVEHYLGCDEPGEASRWAVQAAEQAERALAFGRAAELYEVALALRARGAGDWRLASARGRALALAGDGVRAGRVLERAAGAAEEQGADLSETVRLRADASRELLCGGDVTGGLQALKYTVRSAGIAFPTTPARAWASVIGSRVRLAARGLAYEETSEEALGSAELGRIDACWAGTIGLNSFDAIRSAAFQSRHTLLALAAGEPKRVARALTAEAVYRAAEGGASGRRRAGALLARVESLADRLDDARTTAYAHLCAGVSHYFAGRWSPAIERLDAAERRYARLHGASWEITMCRMYRLWSFAWLGDPPGLARAQDAALEAAAASDDWLAATAAASGHANLRWLLEDDAEQARQRTIDSVARFPAIGFQSPHYADLLAQTRIDLYEGKAWQAWSRIEGAWPRLRGAQLLRLQVFRIELRHLRACAALAAARTADRPRELSAWTPARLVRLATRDARRLRREDLALGAAAAATIEAALAPSPAGARVLLCEAAAGFQSAGAPLFAAISEHIAIAAGGTPRIAAGATSVRNPSRLARIVVPSIESVREKGA